jgi:hypothetical protein
LAELHQDVEAGEPMETVSSSLTFLYKFVFTTVWSAAFGIGTVVTFLSHKPAAMQFAAAWAIGTTFLLLTCAPLKRVKLNGAILVISNYRHDISVPVSEVADVRQNRLINLRPITITFRRETPFGNTVTFMPRGSFRLFSENDIVTRLRSLAGVRSEH